MEKHELIHRGNLVRQKIKDCGWDYIDVYRAIGISQPTFNKRMDDPRLGYKQIKEIGDVISYDFSNDFPEMKPLYEGTESIAADSKVEYTKQNNNVVDCWKRLEQLTVKYIQVLEEKNSIQSAYIDLLDKR